MIKHALTLSLALCLGAAGAQSAQPTLSPTAARSAPVINPGLPNQAPFNKKVSLTSPIQGVALDAALMSLAKSVGLTPVLKDVPKTPVQVSFKDKPFRDVFTTLIETYGEGQLAYRVMPGNLLVIAPESTVRRVSGEIEPSITDTTKVVQIYESSLDSERMLKIVSTLFPTASGSVVDGVVLVYATQQDHLEITRVVEALNRRVLEQMTRQQLPSGGEALPSTDAPAPAVSLPELRVYPLLGSSENVKQAIGAFVTEAKVSLMPDIRVMLIEATPDVHTRIEQVLARVNTERVTGGEIKSYPVVTTRENVEAALKLFVPEARMTFDPAGRIVIVDGTVAVHARVRDILGNLAASVNAPAKSDQGDEATYPLMGEAAEIKAAVARFLPEVQLEILPTQGLIVARATPADQVRLVRLLNQINVAPSIDRGENGVAQKFFNLNYAKAQDVATQISLVFGGMSTGSADEAPTADASKADQNAAANQQTAPVGGDNVNKGTGDSGTTQSAKTSQSKSSLGVVADTRSNSVIVTGTPRQIQMIAATIAQLDVPVKQVRLNVRIEELNANEASKLGINWSASAYGVSLGGGSDGLSVGYTLGSNGLVSLNAQLEAMAKNGQSNTITNTSMLITDNNKGALQSGGKLQVKMTDTSTGTEGTSTTTRFATYTYGLKLNFVPRLSRDGNVELVVDTAIDGKPVGDFNNYFTIDGRTLNTVVNIASGQTVVLGGIVTDTQERSKQGVPVLSKIPVLGGLFSKTEQNVGKTTLLIIITPEVVDNQGRPVFPNTSSATQQKSVPVGTPASPAAPKR